MKLRRARVRGFALPLVAPIGTAHGAIDRRRGWLLEIEDESGCRGFGEATPLPSFGTETHEACRAALLRALEPAKLALGTAGLETATTPNRPCAQSAISAACADLDARRRGRSLSSVIRERAGSTGAPLERVAIQALVSGAEAEAVAAHARRALAAGFRSFKLKLAVTSAQRDPALDLDRVAALRSVVGSAARVRLDANEAWSHAEAEAALAALSVHGIDFVEQPVARANLAALKALSETAPVPVAADESLLGDGWQRCLDARVASVFVLKPAALGGLAAALEVWRRATALEIRVVWSTLLDGAVGRGLALALASGLGNRSGVGADEVHGLGTAGLLAADLVPRGVLDRADALDDAGCLGVPSGAGLGFEPTIDRSIAETAQDFEVEL